MEETGFDYTGPLNQLSRRVKDGIDFTTFGAGVDEEFKPTLNAEHDFNRWIEPKQAMLYGGLHPGLKTTLEMPYMNKLDIAKAIRDKELALAGQYRTTDVGKYARQRARARHFARRWMNMSGVTLACT